MKHIHCPVNGWDCPYYTDVGHTCRCLLDDPYNDPTNAELDELAEDLCHENANSYEYLVHGWNADPVGDGEMTEEEYEESINNYYADCSRTWKEISKEEFEHEKYE